MAEGTHKTRLPMSESRPQSSNRWFWVSIFFDALLFIATSTYAYVAYHQWRVMNNQAILMSQQLETTKRSIEQTQEMLGYARQQASASSIQTELAKESERPYITVVTVDLRDVRANFRPSYIVVFQNSGRTTARQFTMRVIIERRSDPLPENPSYPEPPQVGSVLELGAGSNSRVGGTAAFALSRSDLDALKQRKAWLYVYGIGQYVDGHGKSHTLKFCSYYDSVSKDVSFCTQHNSSV